MARRNAYLFIEETHRVRNFFIGLLAVVLLVVFALTVWNIAMINTVTYTREYVTISTLPDSLESWSILHLSDLNGADLGNAQSAVRTAIGSKTYSFVVLSGNMVGENGDITPVLDLLALFTPGTPVLLLPGDADPPLYNTQASSTLSSYAPWAILLQEAGVTILDEPIAFERSGKTIWFVPASLYTLNTQGTQQAYQDQLDALNAQVEPLDPDQAAAKRHAEFQVARMQRIREKTASMKAADIQVAVTHYPRTPRDIAQDRAAAPEKAIFSMNHVSLILAGGYCGGQWRLPGVGAIWAPDLGFFPNDEDLMGMRYLGGVWQHISPGLGPSPDYPAMPFRLFNSPAATQIVLTSMVR